MTTNIIIKSIPYISIHPYPNVNTVILFLRTVYNIHAQVSLIIHKFSVLIHRVIIAEAVKGVLHFDSHRIPSGFFVGMGVVIVDPPKHLISEDLRVITIIGIVNPIVVVVNKGRKIVKSFWSVSRPVVHILGNLK